MLARLEKNKVIYLENYIRGKWSIDRYIQEKQNLSQKEHNQDALSASTENNIYTAKQYGKLYDEASGENKDIHLKNYQ